MVKAAEKRSLQFHL